MAIHFDHGKVLKSFLLCCFNSILLLLRLALSIVYYSPTMSTTSIVRPPATNRNGDARAPALTNVRSDDAVHSITPTTDNDNEETATDADAEETMSQLTGKSAQSSRSYNNLWGGYFYKLEEKKRIKKENAVASSRQKAADRLKPKQLPFLQKERLAELKQARARQTTSSDCGGSSTSATGEEELPRDSMSINSSAALSSVPVVPQQQSLPIMSKMHSQGNVTRFCVVLLLMSVQFVLLHPELSPRFYNALFSHSLHWKRALVEDAASLSYIMLCGVVHYSICFVALVYAFDTLELGSKAGVQIKKYYSANAGMFVAAKTVAIVGFSVVTALSKVFLRATLWVILQVYVYMTNLYFDSPDVPRWWWLDLIRIPAKELSAKVIASAWPTVQRLKWLGSTVLTLSRRCFLRSNSIGRHLDFTISHVYRLVWATATRLSGHAVRTVEDAARGFEETTDTISWRIEAFETARTLFTYTGCFLVLLLILSTLAAVKSRLPSNYESNRHKVLGTQIGFSGSERSVDDLTQSSDTNASHVS
jgi:hypothetical protein